MRIQADPTSTRLLRRSLSLCVAALLIAALAPLSPANADNHMPWDEPGSAWQGTIETVSHRKSDTSNPEQGYSEYQPRASYTELVPMNSTADGGYAAQIQTSGTHDQVGYCPITGTARGATWTNTWNGAATSDPAIPAIILETDDQGRTFFTPWYGVQMPLGDVTANCGQNEGQQDPGSTMLTFVLAPGDPLHSDNPLPDSDPDPLHLVGERSWTIGDWPAPPEIDWEVYTFTVTYDLRLVTDDCETNYTASDWRRARPEDTPDAPDLVEFYLVTEWCVTQNGRILVTDTESKGETLLSPWETLLASSFEVLWNVKDDWTEPVVKIDDLGEFTTVTATSKWRECYGIPLPRPLRPKMLHRLADLFKKVAFRADSPRVRDRAHDIVRILRKAANKLDDGLRWIANRVIRGLFYLVSKLPERLSIRLANQLVFASWDWQDSGAWAKEYIKGQFTLTKLLNILNKQYCPAPKWKPRIVTTLFKDGTSRSDFIDLDGDYGRWDVNRV